MSFIAAVLISALLHDGVMASAGGGEVQLGCLSAVPANVTVVSGDSTLLECPTTCANMSYNYSYFDSSAGSCACSSSSAVMGLYKDAADNQANCHDGDVWLTALTNSTSTSTTSCPNIGPTSSASLPGYTYLSTYSDPLSCRAACQAAGQGVTLLQPGLGGYSCACADEIKGESYTEVCNAQSWYVVVGAVEDSGNKGAGGRRRRALKPLNVHTS